MMQQEYVELHGKQAKILNKIIETPGLSGVEVSEKLVEVLGHTPIQVIVGALIGIITRINCKFYIKYNSIFNH